MNIFIVLQNHLPLCNEFVLRKIKQYESKHHVTRLMFDNEVISVNSRPLISGINIAFNGHTAYSNTMWLNSVFIVGLIIPGLCSSIPGVKTTEKFDHSEILDSDNKYILFWNFNDTHVTFETHVRTRGRGLQTKFAYQKKHFK